MFLKKMFSRQYWLFTLIVMVGVALCVWAGLWQMERRTEKQELNQLLAERWDAEPINLNQTELPDDLAEFEFRRIQATGTFDYEHQILLKNDFRDGVPGVNIITPLRLDDQRAILVARGWVSLDQATPEAVAKFVESPDAPVVGLIKESQTLEGASYPTEPQLEWFRVDVGAIQQQIPYQLLPAFLAQLPEPGRLPTQLPNRTPPPAPYDEFMHVNYTIQWFTFALIFLFGYIQYVFFQERRRQRQAYEQQANQTGTTTEIPTLPGQV